MNTDEACTRRVMWCASEMKRQRNEHEACTRSPILKIQILGLEPLSQLKLGFFFFGSAAMNIQGSFLVCQKKPSRWFFNLGHTLQFGIGLHHAGLNDKDGPLVTRTTIVRNPFQECFQNFMPISVNGSRIVALWFSIPMLFVMDMVAHPPGVPPIID
ncbi:unnamed protein product [Prunus armeniaca]